jgi:hypothetical protein
LSITLYIHHIWCSAAVAFAGSVPSGCTIIPPSTPKVPHESGLNRNWRRMRLDKYWHRTDQWDTLILRGHTGQRQKWGLFVFPLTLPTWYCVHRFVFNHNLTLFINCVFQKHSLNQIIYSKTLTKITTLSKTTLNGKWCIFNHTVEKMCDCNNSLK